MKSSLTTAFLFGKNNFTFGFSYENILSIAQNCGTINDAGRISPHAFGEKHLKSGNILEEKYDVHQSQGYCEKSASGYDGTSSFIRQLCHNHVLCR